MLTRVWDHVQHVTMDQILASLVTSNLADSLPDVGVSEELTGEISDVMQVDFHNKFSQLLTVRCQQQLVKTVMSIFIKYLFIQSICVYIKSRQRNSFDWNIILSVWNIISPGAGECGLHPGANQAPGASCQRWSAAGEVRGETKPSRVQIQKFTDANQQTESSETELQRTRCSVQCRVKV